MLLIRLFSFDQKFAWGIFMIGMVMTLCRPLMAADIIPTPLWATELQQGQETTIISTGFGKRPMGRGLSKPQEKLLARRAATVDAYRKLASTSPLIVPHIVNGTELFYQNGFIRGAFVISEKTLADGRISVDVAVPVTIRNTPSALESIKHHTTHYPHPVPVISAKPISRDQWKAFIW